MGLPPAFKHSLVRDESHLLCLINLVDGRLKALQGGSTVLLMMDYDAKEICFTLISCSLFSRILRLRLYWLIWKHVQPGKTVSLVSLLDLFGDKPKAAKMMNSMSIIWTSHKNLSHSYGYSVSTIYFSHVNPERARILNLC